MEVKKVKMIIEFEVSCERKAYGTRTKNDLSWKDYAKHDMQMWIKGSDDVSETALVTTGIIGVSFDMGE